MSQDPPKQTERTGHAEQAEQPEYSAKQIEESTGLLLELARREFGSVEVQYFDIDNVAAEDRRARRLIPQSTQENQSDPDQRWVVPTIWDDAEAERIMRAADAFCSGCTGVSKNLMTLALHPAPEDFTGPSAFNWDASIHGIVQGIEQGCQFCRFITHTLLAPGNMRAFSAEPTNMYTCCANAPSLVTMPSDSTVKDSIERLKTFDKKYPDTVIPVVVKATDCVTSGNRQKVSRLFFEMFAPKASELTPKLLRAELGFIVVVKVEVFAALGDETSECIKNRPINPNPTSKAGIQWALDSIKSCVEDHGECPDASPKPLPTRVVEILQNDRLRIRCMQSSDKGLYAALSYCWGGPQAFQLTKTSMAPKIEGFEKMDLPQTLRDAVSLTEKLGLRYIWIDSLCLIQDDDSDKDVELGRMADYYSQAHVTIAAGSGRCTDGFLATGRECEMHSGLDLPKDLLRLPVITSAGGVAPVYFRQQKPYLWRIDPIETRGWERIISPRLLFYGSQRTLWQCAANTSGDGGNDEWTWEENSKDSFDYSKFKKDVAQVQATSADPGDEDLSFTRLLAPWYRAVEEYTHRALTDPNDKLRAISALASQFTRVAKCTFQAGMWLEDINRQLLWSTYPLLTSRLLETRSGGRKLPTWSWASTANPVTFRYIPSDDATCMVSRAHFASPIEELKRKRGNFQAQALSVPHLILLGLPPLRIPHKAITEMVRLGHKPSESEVAQEMRDGYLGSSDKGAALETFVDGTMAWEAPTNAAFFVMFYEIDEHAKGAAKKMFLHGLILEPVEDKSMPGKCVSQSSTQREKNEKEERTKDKNSLPATESVPIPRLTEIPKWKRVVPLVIRLDVLYRYTRLPWRDSNIQREWIELV